MLHINPNSIPKPLKAGDEVMTIAVSSLVKCNEKLLEGIDIFRDWGLVCKNNNITDRNWGYLAGKDSVRYRELYPKRTTPLIAFARGGWGAARLLEMPQKWQSGWLLGFSDITSLLFARASAGFGGGIHGPLVNTLSGEPNWSRERLRALLFGEQLEDLNGEPWAPGLSEGRLLVANLTVSTHLLGTKYMPDLKGVILILEDVNEAPYRIDRMLTQWRLTGKLKELAGLGFGNFRDCKNDKNVPLNETFQVNEVLIERTKDLGIPIIGNLPVGHLHGNAALPIGAKATIDGNKGILTVHSFQQ